MISARQVGILRLMEEVEAAAQRERLNRAKRSTPFGSILDLDEPKGRKSAPSPSAGPKGRQAPKGHSSPFLDDLKRRPRIKGAPAPLRAASTQPALVAPAGGGSAAAFVGAGYQPAVLKVISYGHGVTRAGAMAAYVHRDVAALETHDGRMLDSREEATEEMRRWSNDFEKRKPSNDVATFTIRIDSLGQGDDDAEQLRVAVASSFAGHSHAYRVEIDGNGRPSARVVTSLAGRSPETGSERIFVSEGRSRDDGRLARKSAELLKQRLANAVGVETKAVHLAVNSPSHGKNGVLFQLGRATTSGRGLTTHDGRPVGGNVDDIKQIARAWERGLRSHAPRDTMHMILSAKAGTDEAALVNAARTFLHQTFANHKFVFALHNDKADNGHIHVHAVVAVRSEDGQKMDPRRDDLRQWRQTYAQAAQAEGIKISATTAMQRASSQSYGSRDKAIVDAADRPRPTRAERDRAYAQLNPQVVMRSRQRMATARANPVRVPMSDRQLAVASLSLADFREQPAALQNPLLARTIDRLTRAVEAGKVIQAFKTATKSETMADTSEGMREELRILNRQAGEAAASLSGESKEQFMRNASQTLNLMAFRADVRELRERGVTHVTSEELHRMASPETLALVAKAHAVAQAERREAERASAVANRAIEAERRIEWSPERGPEALREVLEDRDTTRAAETIAARERREADAARFVADSLASAPAKAIDPNQALSDRILHLKSEQDALEQNPHKSKPQGM